MIYCRTCDLGFCSRHLNEHDPQLFGREHDVRDAREMIEHIPCCICSGIYKPRSEQ